MKAPIDAMKARTRPHGPRLWFCFCSVHLRVCVYVCVCVCMCVYVMCARQTCKSMSRRAALPLLLIPSPT
jgi:hypothetical protein